MAVEYAEKPAQISGCWQTWDEQDQPQIIRSQMGNGDIKVRRRTTGRRRVADVSITLPAQYYTDFMNWFLLNCQAGILPTNMVEPSGAKTVWRFTAAPQISWPTQATYFRATCNIERLPGWPEW